MLGQQKWLSLINLIATTSLRARIIISEHNILNRIEEARWQTGLTYHLLVFQISIGAGYLPWGKY